MPSDGKHAQVDDNELNLYIEPPSGGDVTFIQVSLPPQ